MRPLPWVVAGLGHVYCIHCLLAISNKYPFSGRSEQRAVISDHNLKHLRMIIQSRGSACSGCKALHELQAAKLRELITWH